MQLTSLATQIQSIDTSLKITTGRAVNQMLTVRNWLIGYYIVHYEQHGEDRAEYGHNLIPELAAKLNIKGLVGAELSRCRQFCLAYPSMLGTLSQELLQSLHSKILGTLSQESIREEKANSQPHLRELLQSASFSHFVELIKIDDPVKRQYYELLILKTTPSVRELRRQIETLSFERLGMSGNTALAFEDMARKISPQRPADMIRSHYVFDFLGLSSDKSYTEEELETALLDHIQAFILELGHGFCFEARQQRMLIGDEYFFIDLVFYHRILKCHVLIDLKVEAFSHANAGQLNTYLNYYRKNILQEGDNPPVGILLVTDKNDALVEYATASMDEALFVKKYLLQLPSIAQLADFIRAELARL
jgi:predicted nuclease of restriction endonuclease-like (RecB) superfamily